MRALWCSSVLGLICMLPAQGMANAVTVAQTPISISEVRVNSSAHITCSITSTSVLALALNRRFDTEKDVIYLSLERGQIGTVTTHSRFKGRVDTKLEVPEGTSLRISFTLSQLQVDETDLYFCHWQYFETELETFRSDGSIVIVNEGLPEAGQCSEDFYLPDHLLLSLSIIALPVLILFLLMFLVCVMYKRFHKKCRTSRASCNLPRGRPPHRPRPPPPNPNYSYLSTSVSLHLSQV
ncbi:uncharacterized protein [Eucyclogobius newberryi]|uniref:uncharacterized protein n=1 Tax=Eucyclogobius newberryi TaxID=166745 RepID=UPI003B5B16C8